MFGMRQKLLEWHEDGLISDGQIEQAITAFAQANRLQWLTFLKQVFIWSSVIAFGLSLIYFFAYNWQDLSKFHKFALVEGVMLLNAFAYLFVKKDSVVAATLIFGLQLCVGAFFALNGQIYQTGADTWQLFFTWFLCCIPLAWISRSSASWILVVSLMNLSLFLYVQTFMRFWFFSLDDMSANWLICITNTLALLFFELTRGENKGGLYPGLPSRLTQSFVVLLSVCAFTWMAIVAIFDSEEYFFIHLGFYGVWAYICVRVYRSHIPDLFALSLVLLSVIVVAVCLMMEFLPFGEGILFFLIISIMFMSGAGVGGAWLRKVYQEMEAQKEVSADE